MQITETRSLSLRERIEASIDKAEADERRNMGLKVMDETGVRSYTAIPVDLLRDALSALTDAERSPLPAALDAEKLERPEAWWQIKDRALRAIDESHSDVFQALVDAYELGRALAVERGTAPDDQTRASRAEEPESGGGSHPLTPILEKT